MTVDYTPGLRLSAEDRQFHWKEALRLRAIAQQITTPQIKKKVLERAHEHALLIGLTDENGQRL
jgi:hypothetical protein